MLVKMVSVCIQNYIFSSEKKKIWTLLTTDKNSGNVVYYL